MDTPNKLFLDSFDITSLPDLDVVTLGALELFAGIELPEVDFAQFKRPLVVGSGNAAVTGKLLFADVDAVFADESSYKERLSTVDSIDGAFLLSASGSKHAIEIAEELKNRDLPTVLLTNNPTAPATDIVGADNTKVFPRNREPYTYNTSTYLSMVLSKTQEDPVLLHKFLQSTVAAAIPQNIAEYDAYYLMLPEHFNPVREMFVTKFDELFGPKLMGRVFTEEQTKHAKTVVPMESELFISFGIENEHYGFSKNRVTIPLPENGNYASMIAVGYYLIGCVQKGKPPYFKERITEYTSEISEVFGQHVTPIVE